MQSLFNLIYRYRAFLVFLLLELLCYWLLVRSNPYHSAAFFHSANTISGNIYETRSNLTSYFKLKKVNQELTQENARLREQIYRVNRPVIVREKIDSVKIPDVQFPYQFIAAKVINNSTRLFHNHFTINKGSRHGIEPGMGVIGTHGVTGKIRAVSANFSTAYSLLHTSMLISAKIKSNNNLCTVKWDGEDPRFAKLLYIPRHVKVNKGDTILTSGFNAVYPSNIPIGTIEEIQLRENESFYDLTIRLMEDFSSLTYVYVIENPKKEERLEIESISGLND